MKKSLTYTRIYASSTFYCVYKGDGCGAHGVCRRNVDMIMILFLPFLAHHRPVQR